jgi:hypothetical protein
LSGRAAEPWNGVREPAAYLTKVAVTRGKLMLVERRLRPYLDYSACRGNWAARAQKASPMINGPHKLSFKRLEYDKQ